jgi:hypothetical protein
MVPHLPDPIDDRIEEGTVVARYDERPSPCAKRTFKPLNRLYIQVVRWLVEQEQVWICDHQSCKGDARLLTTREELRRLAVARSWEAEATQCGGDAIINRVTLKRIESLSSRRILWACRPTANLSSVQFSCNPGDLLRPAAHRLGERCRLEQFRVMRRLLREHLNPNAARAFHLAAIRLLSANHHPQQRGLPCAVWANESDPLASGNADAHVAQNRDGANLAANAG